MRALTRCAMSDHEFQISLSIIIEDIVAMATCMYVSIT